MADAKPKEIASPLLQVSGGQTYKINIETVASQVKLEDGGDVQTRLQLLERALAGNTSIRFVDSIAERDALVGLMPGDVIDVADASADETVESGGARYLKIPGGFRKIGEDESLDVVQSWDKLEDKPLSAVEEIDQAVNRQHLHLNSDVLKGLSADEEGNLTYQGQRIDPGITWVCMVEKREDIPASLPQGGLVVIPRDANVACCGCATIAIPPEETEQPPLSEKPEGPPEE